ncbi:nuclear protein DGCR14 [Gymnopilus junonius]|uniref:Nuclear protein DGCR14 n=1 Tax=Gymnopilus junonius TaxID=109634 RepID=A0A9P5NXE5_GYMJU|nr:nuclear protein DGCR14 [Gymnopilus junonius]
MSSERSLNSQVVLEEEEYTEALSQIIARDFFPSLVHLDATNEYLDALQSRDPHLINASVRRLQQVTFTPSASMRGLGQTPSRTPYGLVGETPLRTPKGEPPQKRTRYDMDMNLDDFQARYTSEDNSSFTQIIDEENRVRKEKWAWAWNAQRRVENQQAKMIEQRETMFLEPPKVPGVREKFMIEMPKPAGLITASQEKNEEEVEAKEGGGVVVIRDSDTDDEPVDVMAPVKDTRPAGVDGWKFKARNSLMFPPDADVSPYQAKPTSAEAEANPKSVNYASTRLAEQEHEVSDHKSASAPPSPTRSRVDAAISGTPYRPSSPKEAGFSLIPNLPSPTPAELGPAALKQLMTWGSINATPRIISQGGDPTDLRTPFRIPEISAREAISHRLSDSASKSLRAKAEKLNSSSRTPRTIKSTLLGKKGSMGPPSFTPRKAQAAGNLTPAARRLLQRTAMGTAASRRAEAMEQNAGWDLGSKGKEKDLSRVRWTPTPTR